MSYSTELLLIESGRLSRWRTGAPPWQGGLLHLLAGMQRRRRRTRRRSGRPRAAPRSTRIVATARQRSRHGLVARRARSGRRHHGEAQRAVRAPERELIDRAEHDRRMPELACATTPPRFSPKAHSTTYVSGVWGVGAVAVDDGELCFAASLRRGASAGSRAIPAVYIDGIEVANPLLLTRFNPGSIDRIEVIRGPQGSALYGTDAISGVVNIVTRHEGAPAEGGAMSVRSTFGVSQSSVPTAAACSRRIDVAVDRDRYEREVGRLSYRRGEHRLIHSRRLQSRSDGDGKRTCRRRAVIVERHRATLRASAPARRAVRSRRYARAKSLATMTQSAVGERIRHDRRHGQRRSIDDQWTMSLVAGIDGYRLKNVQASSFTPVQSLLDSALQGCGGRRRSCDDAREQRLSGERRRADARHRSRSRFRANDAPCVASLACVLTPSSIPTTEHAVAKGNGTSGGNGSGLERK